MAKKRAGRQTSRLPIKADVLRKQIAALSLSHGEVVTRAEHAGILISVTSLRGALSAGIASPRTISAFVAALQLSTEDFVVDEKNDHQDVLTSIDRLLATQGRQRIHSQGRIVHPRDPMHCVQDKKNLIRDERLSRALIKGMGVPSLFDAVYNSATFTPLDDAHKDQPFVPGMDYNHFLMIGCVLVLNTPREKTAVGYHRAVSHLKGTYKHTQGLSVLWATGFEFNIKETTDQHMWNWMTLASESPNQAEDAFIGKKDPALLRLLSHKLSLNPRICSISPLCVITNDQRQHKPRVYTQYVFQIEVTPKGKPQPVDKLMGDVVQNPDQPAAVAFKPEVQGQFVNHKGRTNKMDVAAWQQLHRDRRPRTPAGITATAFGVHT